jgi:hypothetical protein
MAMYKLFHKVELQNGYKPIFCYQVERSEDQKPRGNWEADAWKCFLEYDHRQITLPFFMGKGFDGQPPNLFIVLDSCFRDADIGENSFCEFCWEFGYEEWNEDHRETYDKCVEMGRQLRYLFGPDYEGIQKEIESYYY